MTPKAWLISANPKAESLFPHHEVIEIGDGSERGDAIIDAQIDAEKDAEIDGVRNRRGGIPPVDPPRAEWYAARAGRSLPGPPHPPPLQIEGGYPSRRAGGCLS